MSEEWGSWIEHDGNGCPCVGEIVHTIFDAGTPRSCVGVAGRKLDGWHHNWPRTRMLGKITHYRTRKPKGLTILERIAAEPEERVEA